MVTNGKENNGETDDIRNGTVLETCRHHLSRWLASEQIWPPLQDHIVTEECRSASVSTNCSHWVM